MEYNNKDADKNNGVPKKYYVSGGILMAPTEKRPIKTTIDWDEHYITVTSQVTGEGIKPHTVSWGEPESHMKKTDIVHALPDFVIDAVLDTYKYALHYKYSSAENYVKDGMIGCKQPSESTD